MIPQDEEKFTTEQLQMMKTQDLKYVQMKYQVEKNVSNLQQLLLFTCLFVCLFTRKWRD